MIKNKMKSAISVVIVFALLVVTASAAVIQPRWTYIASIVSSLDISDSGLCNPVRWWIRSFSKC